MTRRVVTDFNVYCIVNVQDFKNETILSMERTVGFGGKILP